MAQQYFYPVVPISGSISVSNPSIGTNGSTAPTSSTEVGGVGPDGNLHPLSTDNSGVLNVNTTPTTGSIQHVIVDSSALPTGASTSALQTTGNTSISSIDGKTPALGQALAAASVPVVLPATQITALTPPTTVTVSQPTAANLNATVTVSNFPGTQSISGTVTVQQPTAANLNATVTGTVGVSSLPSIPAGANAIGSVSISNFPATQPVSGTVAVTQSTTPWADNISQFGGTSVSIGQQLSAASIPVVLPAAQITTLTPPTTVTVTQGTAANLNATVTGSITANIQASGTSTLTNVNGSASSVSLLVSNSSRKNAVFYNDSTAILYIKFGTTASTTSYTVQMVPGAYFEMPVGPIYTGAIDGIWSAANGAVRITELS